ncbi:hypothetical protein PVC01_120036900 [Plasmodium vivax]|uniref:(malaria parasite P. vivax) hypothetical protein n=1 Tax=Plasmodium vivax TaxID=5855 RepID=A0A1G4HGY2_PLAVI|nr:unnamed protein product [Plasmodium vivax]CAI7722144.1 hypothetical protein PVPAM_120038200 [Plasmodium vivax]SCO68712.1 hypothetical protein PVT01_120037400 [Plasmodium vivax]SCO74175.1 hypothetical protein PVC01_120036900 [Plasmodium vivax]
MKRVERCSKAASGALNTSSFSKDGAISRVLQKRGTPRAGPTAPDQPGQTNGGILVSQNSPNAQFQNNSLRRSTIWLWGGSKKGSVVNLGYSCGAYQFARTKKYSKRETKLC